MRGAFRLLPLLPLRATLRMSTSSKPHVVLVGTGFGGAGLLHELHATNEPLPFDLTLIEAKTNQSIGASWQYVWSDRLTEAPTWPMQSLQRLSVAKTVKLGLGDASTVSALSVEDKTLTLKDGTVIPYDSLVLSPGVVSDASKVPGLAESIAIDICDLKSVPDMKALVDKLVRNKAQQTIMVCVTKMPYKCPPVPFEYVSLLDDMLRAHGTRDNTRLILAVPVPFPFAGPPAQKLFCGLLEEMEIEYWGEHEIESLETVGDQSTATFKVGGESKAITVDGLFCTFPQRAPDFCKPICNPGGYVTVDLQTNQYGDKDIFVLGDASHSMFPAAGKPHPKAGEFAWLMGQHVAHQLVAKYYNEPQPPPPARLALCVAECGANGRGVNIQPDFGDILADPSTGMPKFRFDIVDGVAQLKVDWINKYVEWMFGSAGLKLPDNL